MNEKTHISLSNDQSLEKNPEELSYNEEIGKTFQSPDLQNSSRLSGIYYNPNHPKDDQSWKQNLFNVDYNGTLLTFVREKWASKVFQIQNIPVVKCEDTLSATTALKNLLKPHEMEFSELCDNQDWFSSQMDQNLLFQLKNKLLPNNHYAGFQDTRGKMSPQGSESYIVLPVMIGDSFVIWASNWNFRWAYFTYGFNEDAHMIWSFK